MPESDKDMDEVKKNIRSLLLSAPVGLTLDELRNDYEEFMGDRLPTHKFGFSSDEDFILQMPDVVRITRKPGGELVLMATADEKTQHIAKMVSKQKVDLSKWGATSTRKRRARGSASRGRGRGGSQAGRSGRSGPGPRSADARHAQGQAQAPIVPFSLRNSIQQFLDMFSGGVPLGHFEQAFNQKMGFRLDYEKIGYGSLEILLGKIPDTVHLSYRDYGEVRVEKAQRSRKPLLSQPPQTVTSPDRKQQSRPSQPSQQPPQGSKKSQQAQPQQTASSPKKRQQPLLSQPPQPEKNPPQQSSQQSNKSQSNTEPPKRSRANKGKLPPWLKNKSPTSERSPHSPEPDAYRDVNNSSSNQQLTASQMRDSVQQSWRTATSLSQPQSPEKETANPDFTRTQVYQNLMEEMCDINPALQNKIKQVLVMRPKGVWASRLPFEFKEKYKEELPYKDQGFSSVIEFMSVMPHIVRVERPNPKGDWLLFDASQPADKGDMDDGADLPDSSARLRRGPHYVDNREGRPAKQVERDETLKESIRQVLQAHTDGVSLFHFKEIYEEMTGLKLDPEEYGMPDIHTLLISLTSDVLRIEYRGQNISHLFALPSPGPCRFDYLLDCYKPHAIEPEDEDVYIDEDDQYDSQVPEDAVGPGVSYTPLPLPRPNPHAIDQSLDMNVTYVVNPGYFWVQRRGSNYNLALDALMDALEETYEKQGDYYRMPENLMAYGQVCATLFPEDNNWHRGVITGRNHGMVEVYYVDYGNTCFVPISSIRFLRKRFLKLPAQAIQARLAHIQPVGGTWSQASKEEMLNVVRAKPMVALITSINRRVLSLCLTDTSGDVDIHLNDLLVHKGHAIFVEDKEEEEQICVPAVQTIEQPLASPDLPSKQLAAPLAAIPLGSPRYVRQVDVTEDVGFHLINLHGSPYVMSTEISALFWEDDILCSMLLKQNEYTVSKLVVTRDQFPTLFEELIYYGALETPSPEVLSLYEITGLPLILKIFGDNSTFFLELTAAVHKVLQNFDPNDPYWRGEDSDSVSVSQVSESTDQDTDLDDVLTMEELQMALRSLQILRKRILKRMIVDKDCTSDNITELEGVEVKIKQTQNLIEALDSSSSSEVRVPSDIPQSRSARGLIPPSPQSDYPPSTVKTNVVAPMNIVAPIVQPTTTAAMSTPGLGQIASCAPVSGQDNMGQRVAAMEEIIRQQDQVLRSMLQMGFNPNLQGSVSVPGISSTNPTTAPTSSSLAGVNLETLSISDPSQQAQQQSQFLNLGLRFPTPGVVNPQLQNPGVASFANNPALLRMQNPLLSSAVRPGESGTVQPQAVQPFMMPMPSLLRAPSNLPIQHPFLPASSTGQPPSSLQPSAIQQPFSAVHPSMQPLFTSVQSSLPTLQPSLTSIQPTFTSDRPVPEGASSSAPSNQANPFNPIVPSAQFSGGNYTANWVSSEISGSAPGIQFQGHSSGVSSQVKGQDQSLRVEGQGHIGGAQNCTSGVAFQLGHSSGVPGQGHVSRLGFQAPGSFQPAGAAGGGLTRGQLLPGMLTLLDRFRASGSLRPTVPTTSALPTNQNQ